MTTNAEQLVRFSSYVTGIRCITNFAWTRCSHT